MKNRVLIDISNGSIGSLNHWLNSIGVKAYKVGPKWFEVELEYNGIICPRPRGDRETIEETKSKISKLLQLN